MIIRMMTSRRPQQRYDHRLRDLVYNTGDVTIATDLGVPRSTARGWLRKGPSVAVTVDVTNVKTSDLQSEVLELRRRMKKLRALLRLALALLRSSGFTMTHERLPDGRDKHGSCEPGMVRVTLCRCGRSCGSCDCLPVVSMRGDGGRRGVRLTTGRLVRTRRPVV